MKYGMLWKKVRRKNKFKKNIDENKRTFTYKYTSILLVAVLLLFACSKEEPGKPVAGKTQLVLTASSTEVEKGDEVSFTVSIKGKIVEADIYVNDIKIKGTKYAFEDAGEYQVVARKEGHKDTERAIIKAFQIVVYVAGYEQESSISVAKYWENDKVISLTNGGMNAEAHSVFVADGDVYVAGHEGGRVQYWKNGTGMNPIGLNTIRGTAYSIFVHQGDVYVAGWEYNDRTVRIAKYWKNGVSVPLTDGSGSDAVALSIFVENGDVYVAGYEYNGIRDVAKYWKNGIPVTLTDGSNDAFLTSIFVENKDVYVAGYEYNGSMIGGISVAKYWKNGTSVSLSDGSGSVEARSIFVDNGDVYVAGMGFKGYWKNDTSIPFAQGTRGGSCSVFVNNKDVYVSGTDIHGGNAKVAYWKNGDLVLLSKGSKYAAGNSIYVSRTLGNSEI